MNFIKKTIFLSNNDKNKGMAILSLENKNSNVFGTIKVYSDNLKGEYVLGLKSNEKIIKQNIKLEGKLYNFILSDKVNLSENLGCVLLKVDNHNILPVLWGSEKNENYKGKIINTLRESIEKLTTSPKVEISHNNSCCHQNNVKNLKDTCQKTLCKTNLECNCCEGQCTQTQQQVSQSSLNEIYEQSISEEEKSKRNENINKPTYLENKRRFENIILQMDDVINDKMEDLIGIQNENQNLELNNETYEQAYSPIKHQIEIQSHDIPADDYSQISLNEELITTQNKDEIVSKNIDEIAVACNTAQLFESDDKEIEEVIDKELYKFPNGKHNFYDMIADQLNELFERYPREENLCKLIDNSNWVKIDTGIDNKYHVVGIITYNDDIKYICYGVPGQYANEPPIELREYSQWLPTDINDPYNKGYWVMYQDADTGENIVVN
ncbi:MAG: hypothetical protein ACI4PF_04665 [Christensenellales bacterium]